MLLVMQAGNRRVQFETGVVLWLIDCTFVRKSILDTNRSRKSVSVADGPSDCLYLRKTFAVNILLLLH